MRNAEIAAALRELGTLYELDGADRFRVGAYKDAAKVAADSPVSLEQLSAEGPAARATRASARRSRSRWRR